MGWIRNEQRRGRAECRKKTNEAEEELEEELILMKSARQEKIGLTVRQSVDRRSAEARTASSTTGLQEQHRLPNYCKNPTTVGAARIRRMKLLLNHLPKNLLNNIIFIP